MNKKEFKELDKKQMIIAFNQLKDDYSSLFDELQQEKEKNKELEKYKTYYEEMEEVNKKFIAVDKIKEKMEQTKKVYEDEMKPYQREYGLDVTYLSKKEKEELINKRNCLLTQIKTYEMLLEDK